MSYPFAYKLFPAVLSVFSLTVAVSCTHSHSDAHDENVAEEGHDHEDEIVMSPADAMRFGVMAEAAVKTPFCEIVKVSGEVLPAATDRSVVSAPTSGIVRLVLGIEQGKAVGNGELIASISAGNMTGEMPTRWQKRLLTLRNENLTVLLHCLKMAL